MGPYKSFHLLTDLIEKAAECYPQKEAFRFKGDALTYEELLAKSRRLTTVLLERGVVKGDRVGVVLHQSLETSITIYGILGAGACFVPIDPFAPAKRVRQILDKCSVRHLVTHAAKAETIKEVLADSCRLKSVIGLENGSRVDTCYIGWDEVMLAVETPPVKMIEMDLAYIMFTSGSTGVPKGMMHTHANGMIYADNLVRVHSLKASDRFLNLAPLHFDMAIMDYIASPMVGGTTIIVPESYARMPASLTALAAEERVTIWYSVPFAMTQMLQFGAMEKHDFSSLRWMIYGGEAISIKHLRALMLALPNARFCNAYGPAETHQVSSYNLDEFPDKDMDVVPIGKPWSTVDVLIVDENDQPVEGVESGELLVRTPSCMRGYWGDEEKTRAAFFYREVVGQIRDVYYRTGDIVMMKKDGMMFFHGRKDRQIKIRGYRVELDEVEAILATHPVVNECAVIRSGDGQSLIAAVSAKKDKGFDCAAILSNCARYLPQYAVPAQLHLVERFPRTPSNKIDRIKLARELDANLDVHREGQLADK